MTSQKIIKNEITEKTDRMIEYMKQITENNLVYPTNEEENIILYKLHAIEKKAFLELKNLLAEAGGE
jgi:hypothetical protein